MSRGLLGVVLLATLMRVFSLAAESVLPSFVHHRLDALLYHDAARAIVAGDLALGREVLHMSPAYSYFLGLIYALFGDGPWAPRIVQLLLGVATVAFTALTARRMFGSLWGNVAGLLAALYGPLIFYESQLGAVTLAAFLNTLLVYLAVRIATEPSESLARWLGLGAAFGGCVLTRPNTLLYALPLAFLAWHATPALAPRRLAALVAALGLAAAVVIAPVTLRNRLVAGEWVLVTDSGGLNFYLGNAEGATGTFRVPRHLPDATSARKQFDSFRAAAERETGKRLSSRELDAHYYDVTWRDIGRDPGRFVSLLVEKAWLYWNRRELPNTEDYEFHRLINPVLGLPLVGFALIAPFALFGWVLLLARRDATTRFVGLTVLVHFAALVGFFVLSHYRLPIVTALILCAVATVDFVHKAVLARDRVRLGMALAAVVAALPIVLATKLPKAFDDEWYKLGYAYHVLREPLQAEHAYRRALAINGQNISAHKNLARLYEATGRPQLAREHWHVVVELARRRNLPAYRAEAEAALAALR